MSSFDALIKQLEDFRRMIHSGLGAPSPKRQRQSHSGEKGTPPSRYDTIALLLADNDTNRFRKLIPPYSVSHVEPSRGLSAVTTSIGVISQTFLNRAQHFERIAEQAVFPSCVVTPEAPAQVKRDTKPGAAPSNPPTRKRLGSPIELAEPESLPGLVDALLRDLPAFASRVDVFNTVFAELARAQDIFILYLKDGQSGADQGYRSEIDRLRRHLPCVCNALDAYSKARLS
ncbi:hypothetical protein V8E55_012080 [Tylopilus felleus]